MVGGVGGTDSKNVSDAVTISHDASETTEQENSAQKIGKSQPKNVPVLERKILQKKTENDENLRSKKIVNTTSSSVCN